MDSFSFYCKLCYRAADYLVRTGPVVTLEVAKQGAIYHGLATLLQQPSPLTQRGESLFTFFCFFCGDEFNLKQ